MKRFLLVLLCGLASVTGGCQREHLSPDDEAAILATVRENITAMEHKDMDAVMATIHSASPEFDINHDVLMALFEDFDLKYTLSDLKVIGVKDGEARVSFVQKTEKIAGPDSFKNNLVEGVHALRLEDGRWKIYSTPSVRVKEVAR